MDIILDFQGFKDNCNQFVIKELAISSTDGAILQHWFVRSPFPYYTLDMKRRRECTWNTKHHHGISWADGDITIQDLHLQLCPILTDSIVYVKGLEKAGYLQEFFKCGHFMDLEDYPALKELQTTGVYCFHHKDKIYSCALNNVTKLVKYYCK